MSIGLQLAIAALFTAFGLIGSIRRYRRGELSGRGFATSLIASAVFLGSWCGFAATRELDWLFLALAAIVANAYTIPNQKKTPPE